MTTTFVATLIIAIAVSASLIVVSLHHYRRQTKMEKLPASFKSAAAAFDLSITKQETLGNRVIGMDDGNGKLLFLEAKGHTYDGYLVGFGELKGCSVKREYATIYTDTMQGGRLESYINKIVLKLNYKDGTQPTALTFYNRATNPEREMRARAEQAHAWQALLSATLAKTNSKPVPYKKSAPEEGAFSDFIF